MLVEARAHGIGTRLNAAQGTDRRDIPLIEPSAGLPVLFFREVELLPDWHCRCVAPVKRL